MADAAVAAASGQDWFGYKNKGPVSVVYFALERVDLVRRRLLATAARRGITGKLAIAVVPGIIDLARPASVKKAIATIREAEVEFVSEDDFASDYCGLAIFDTFAKIVAGGGGDEDKAKDRGRYSPTFSASDKSAEVSPLRSGRSHGQGSRPAALAAPIRSWAMLT